MIEVFTARKIITMNESWPEATAIAVRDGVILEVGSLETSTTGTGILDQSSHKVFHVEPGDLTEQSQRQPNHWAVPYP